MDYHDVRFSFDPQRSRAWKAITRFLAPYLKQSETVLEIGAGYCSFINEISAPVRYALDVSDIVRAHAGPGVTPLVQDATKPYPLSDSSVDTVLASNIFEHIERADLGRTLDEIHRVLKPGGTLVVVQPNFKFAYRDYFDDYTHVAVFTDVSLADRLRIASFDIRRVMPKFLPYSLKSVSLPVPAWIISLYLYSPWKPKAGQMLVIAVKP